MSPLKILLVDDAKFFLEVAKGFLKRSSATIFTAENGREALQVARKVRPHLIFLDLHMPEMDGASCCAALKSDPVLGSIPVIMVVTPSGDLNLDVCREAGCDLLLTKPVDRTAFLDACRTFLSTIERRERRVLCRATVACRLPGTTTFYGTIEDISESGMFIGSGHSVAKGETIGMSFLLPGTGCDVIEATGRVVWTNSGTHREFRRLPAGFGIEFVDMTAALQDHVRSFIEHCELRHQPPMTELFGKGRG